MKKLILIPVLLVGTLAMAKQYDFEFTPVIGYNYTEGNLDIKDHSIFGAELQYNGFDFFLKPELSVLYSRTNSENIVPSVDQNPMYRVALNGVYEYGSLGMITPLAKIGVGYEASGEHYSGNEDSRFLDAGLGAKIPFTDALALKLEAVYMMKCNDHRFDNNAAVLAGLNFAFGGVEQKAAPVVAAPAPVVKAPVVVAPAPVKKVEVKAEKVNLHINFETDSAKIDNASVPRVEKFSTFLKKSPEYKAQIIGHTDSTASDAHNDKLSNNRANAVKDMIIKNGVAADRVSAVGKGEKEPVANNKTKEGRAENRRIEAQLIETK
ncbi:MAG: OmpA family protein [Sulfurimonas sp.]|jgi:OOP family OmpA-OmpF porin